jgi:hypothetical protein
MPDRYGDDEPVVDFDSRRKARDTAASAESARRQRERIAQAREVHAPLDSTQSAMARQHRADVTARAEAHRNAERIANCPLCNEDGYRGCTICDHIDHRPAAARGMAKIRAALTKPHQTPKKPGDGQ